MLQAELGLLSSPIEHDQVRMVSAVDPQDASLRNHETTAQEATQEQETVAARQDSPAVSEKETSDDLFGFDGLGDCDIPKNAFATPKKTKPSRKSGTEIPMPVEESAQDIPATPACVQEPEPAANDTVFDPLLSAELPISLWQPRKPASVAKPPTAKPSFSDNTRNPSGAGVKVQKSEPGTPEATPMPVDDLARHSSGKPRQDRGKGRQEKFDDHRPGRDFSAPPRRDEPRREPREFDSPKHRTRKETAPHASFDDGVFDNHVAESSLDDVAWEPKIPKSRERKPDKVAARHAEESPFPPSARDKQAGFAADLEREMEDDHDWLSEGGEREQILSRPPRKDRKPKSYAETRKNEPEKPARNAGDREDDRIPYSSREPLPSSRPPTEVRTAGRAASSATGQPTQKIAVPSWDDAVRDIIEKNMQRHPVTKNERQGNNRGRRR